MSESEESSWTACRARCRAIDNVCRDVLRGGHGGSFRGQKYAGGGCREYGGGGEAMVRTWQGEYILGRRRMWRITRVGQGGGAIK